MDENKLRFGVGVLVISAIGIGIVLIFLFGAFPSVLSREYALSAVFPSAEGIGANTPVVRDGVRIGRVSSINLRDEGGVLVTLSMDSNHTLPHRYVPRIGSGNFVTGDAQLEFVRASEPALNAIFGEDREILDKPYTDGEFLHYGTKSESLFELQDDLKETFRAIQSAGESIASAGENVNELAVEVREIVGGSDSKVDQVADEVVETLEEFQAVIRDVRAIVGDPETQADIESSIRAFPELLASMQEAVDSTQQVFDTLERAGAQFEKVGIAAEDTVNAATLAVENVSATVDSTGRTIRNLEQFTAPLAERGDELVDQAIRSLASLESSLVQVEQFGRTLNNSDGTLKRFLEDDEIYWQVKRSVENVEMATARIRPILDDVRTFTDKIARDPRELGIRGAISRRPSGAGLK